MSAPADRRPGARSGRRAIASEIGRRAESGQALVEFALIVPILALLVLMVVDFGRVYGVQVVLINAAREGARYCALHQDDSDYASKTLQRVTAEMDGTVSGATVTGCEYTAPVSPATRVRGSGTSVTVTVKAPFVLVSPLLCTVMVCIPDPGPPARQTIVVQATATMVVW